MATTGQRRLNQVLGQRPVIGQRPCRPLQCQLACLDELRETFSLATVAGLFVTPMAATSYVLIEQATTPAHRTEAFTWLSTGQGTGNAARAALAGILTGSADAAIGLGILPIAVGLAALIARSGCPARRHHTTSTLSPQALPRAAVAGEVHDGSLATLPPRSRREVRLVSCLQRRERAGPRSAPADECGRGKCEPGGDHEQDRVAGQVRGKREQVRSSESGVSERVVSTVVEAIPF